MRKRLKTERLPLSMLANRDCERPIRTIRCDNVRIRDGRLGCVALPKRLDIIEAQGMPGGRLLDVVESDRLGRIGIFDKVGGTHLGYALIDGDRRIRVLAPSPGDVTGARMLSGRLLVILSPSGVMEVEVNDNSLEWKGSADGCPDFRFEVYDLSVRQVSIAGRRLGGSYGEGSSRLNASDSSVMIRDAREAIGAVMDEAARRGLFAQGVLARYRLRDHEGRTLFVSVPVLLTHPRGLNFIDECQAIMSEDGKSYDDWTLQAGEFRVGLRMPDTVEYDWGRLVSDVVVEMSPPVHVIGRENGGACELRARAAGGFSVVYRPGGAPSSVGTAPDRASGVIETMLAAGDTLFSRVAVVGAPFGRGGMRVAVDPPVTMCGDLDSQIAAISAPERHSFPPLTMSEALVRLPNRFGAASVARCGTNVVWGDITVSRYAGMPCDVLAAETADESWEGMVVTEFTDRTVVVRRCGGETGAPVSLYPLICYPSPDAVKITVTVKTASGLRKGEYPLHSALSGCCSLWMSDDSRYNRLEVAQGDLQPAVSTGTSVRMSGALVVTKGGDMGSVTAVLPSASAGRIAALVEMPRRGSAWEGGMLRIGMLATDGVSVVSVNDGGDRIRVQPVDSRGVSGSSAVTATTTPGASVVAVAGGDLVKIDSSVATTLVKGIGESCVAWDNADSELWVVNPDEGFPRVIPGCGDSHYRLTSLLAGRMWTTSRGLIVEDDEGLLRDCSLGREEGDISVHWEVQVEAPLRKGSGRPMALTDCVVELRCAMPVPKLDLLAGPSSSHLRIIPEKTRQSDEPRLCVASLSLRGRAVVTTRVSGLMAPPRRWVWLRLIGEAHHAMELYGPRLIFG